jgi:S-adenosylmethionine-diacylglycerol 3-amino-3-carboxypropyl transferase
MSDPSPIYFAQVREDAEIERAVVRETRATVIVTIASGGCTALSLLTDRAGSVAAVDTSAAQCALVELRRAALVGLCREEHLAFIGERRSDDRLQTYDRLRGRLPDSARAYWDARLPQIAEGIQHAGVTERFYRFVGKSLRHSVTGEEVWERLFDPGDRATQRELLDRHFRTEGFRAALRVILSKTSHLEFFPASMFAQASEHEFGDFFWERFESGLVRLDQRDNYFLHQVLFGRYLGVDRGTPWYLSPDGYEEARRNAHKLAVIEAGIADYLEGHPGAGAVFLSNVFDWAPPSAQVRIAESTVRSLARGGAFVFRNMLADPPLPEPLRSGVLIHEAWGSALLAVERSLLYRRLVVGTRS